ncbi:CaiB/BaiF CoA-transferase family protein [Microbispora sp. H11081]|uniref:CaiB/BaiF CoA transferase family protein n=1 Tax=Microbispora sp. H11081 TaxID=2729107 RepID=UPI001474C3E9|nr:CoA transferase [Microbispora sp. H11081]
MSELPLNGLRVVDLGSFWAAPYLTAYLGAYGADVVKIESTQRPDGFRFTSTLPALGDRWFDRSLLWQATNLNKRNVTLDLGREEGKKLLRRLCETGDVFVENYAARVVEQFGFDQDTLLELNPRMIVLRLPGFGLTGPWRDFVGWGNAFEQLAGLAWVTGYADGRPLTPGGYIDPTVGMHAAVALLAALEHRDRTGEGQLVEVPQIEVGASMAAESVIAWSTHGRVPGRQGNRHPVFAPQGVYPCEDGGWVALSVRDDRDWEALVSLDGRPAGLAEDALRSHDERRHRLDELDDLLRGWFAGQACDELVAQLQAVGVPAARALTPDRFNEDPQLVARDFYQELEHPLSGPRLFPRYPMTYSFDPSPPAPHRFAAPLLGEHNEEILAGELGLTAEQLAELADASIIGTVPKGI